MKQTNSQAQTNSTVVTRREGGWEKDEEGRAGQIYGDCRLHQCNIQMV